ncbi:MAG: glycosyltransferase [Bacteroidota bacterium]
MRKYSIVIPVYNRPVEVEELLESLLEQTYDNFEVIIVEDGSSDPCLEVVKRYREQLDIQYFFKENTGPGDSRNFGMNKATGDYIVLFDSDCLIPEQYFREVEKGLNVRQLDAYGGPDAAHESFTIVQKAINYAMTSFITTGGIRGKEKNLDHFTPRSFNMGVSKAVYDKVGGFSDVHPGEDPDWSYRIMDEGFKTGLLPKAFVYHKRRIDFKKFRLQVYKFGVVRNILMLWHPTRFKPVFLLPTLFLLGSISLLILAFVHSVWWLFPLGLLAGLLFADALVQTGELAIALRAVPASFMQLYGYGWGFLRGYLKIHLQGIPPREAFPKMFFNQPADEQTSRPVDQ